MLLHRPFAAITPTLDGDVLLVLARADASFTGGELARLIPHASADGVRKAAQRLVQQGTVTLDQIGRAYNYRLNSDHVLADAIIAVATAEDRIVQRLRTTVERWPEMPKAVILFGSAARREMSASSDLDVLVVGDEQVEDVTFELADDMSSWTGNDVRGLRLPEHEIRRRLDHEDPFIQDVLSEGRMLWGPANYLRRLRRGPVA